MIVAIIYSFYNFLPCIKWNARADVHVSRILKLYVKNFEILNCITF